MNNIAPFYIGQQVVCVKPIGQLKKDKVYTVLGLFFCDKCKGWMVGFSKHGFTNKFYTMTCFCGVVHDDVSSEYYHASAIRFVPLHENFQSITLEKVIETEKKLTCAN